MSKIGRKPIAISSAKVEINDKSIKLSGPKGSVTHEFPENIKVVLEGNFLNIKAENNSRRNNMLWGLHRALIANKVKGVQEGFELKVKIVGLGFKAQLSGRKLILTLGYSHKVEYAMPNGVDVDIDKTGQLLNFKSIDKSLLGKTCDTIRSFRVPEPYKGTGIIRENEVIRRKAGKAKAAAGASK